jgi:putative FmdB family regulatory protein
MPIYSFKCDDCENNFEVFTTYDKSNTEKFPCEECSSTNTKKIPSLASFHMGLTVAEKNAGVKPSRRDMGNYMKDARDKRKKEFGPNSREGQSNELWTGGEYDKSVWKGPSSKKKK